jgi:hypothetical protein
MKYWRKFQSILQGQGWNVAELAIFQFPDIPPVALPNCLMLLKIPVALQLLYGLHFTTVKRANFLDDARQARMF